MSELISRIDPSFFYGTNEVRQFLNLSEATVRNMMRDEEIPGSRKMRGQWKILGSFLIEYIRNGEQDSTQAQQ